MGVLLLALYGAAVLGLGYACRPRGEAGLFFVNNRASGAWLVGFSLVASCVGASAAMGAAGLAFAVGTPAFWWLGSGAAGLSLLALVLARKVRRSRARTLPEIVEAFFGPRVRRIISCVIVAAWLSILAAQLTALARILVAMTGLSPGGALIAGGLFLAAHTMLGGQAGIIRLDRWQVVLMAAGFFAILFRLGGENPAVFPSLALEAVNADFPPSRLIHFLVILGGGYVVCPMLFGRLLSARDEEAARRGALGAAVGLALASVLIVAVGLLARGLIPPETAEDAVLIAAIQTAFPHWAALALHLVLAGVVLSSADSCLITAALVLSNDILRRPEVAVSRLCVMGLTMAGLALTLTDRSILGFLLMANEVYVCGVVGPVFAGLLLARRPARSPSLAAAGVLLGGGLGLASSLLEAPFLSYAGIALSLLLALRALEPLPALFALRRGESRGL